MKITILIMLHQEKKLNDLFLISTVQSLDNTHNLKHVKWLKCVNIKKSKFRRRTKQQLNSFNYGISSITTRLGRDGGMKVFLPHCVESVQILSFFWSVFSCIRTKYGDLLSKSPHSDRIQENADQKILLFGHFSRSGIKYYK